MLVSNMKDIGRYNAFCSALASHYSSANVNAILMSRIICDDELCHAPGCLDKAISEQRRRRWLVSRAQRFPFFQFRKTGIIRKIYEIGLGARSRQLRHCHWRDARRRLCVEWTIWSRSYDEYVLGIIDRHVQCPWLNGDEMPYFSNLSQPNAATPFFRSRRRLLASLSPMIRCGKRTWSPGLSPVGGSITVLQSLMILTASIALRLGRRKQMFPSPGVLGKVRGNRKDLRAAALGSR